MNQNDTLKFAKEALQKALEEKKLSQDLIKNLGPAILEALKPTLEAMSSNSKLSKEELLSAISKIKIDIPKTEVPEANVNVTIPEIKVPQPIVNVTVPKIEMPAFPEVKLPVIKVPEPKVTVNFDATKIKIPDIKMPEEMAIKGWVGLMGYEKSFLTNPLPVQLRDSEGNPVKFFDNLTQILNGAGGGGKRDFFSIKGFAQSAFAEIMNSDGQVKVAGTFTASAPATAYVIPGNSEGVVYNSDNPLPVVITSGAGGSTAAALIDSSGVQYSGSNPLPVVITSGGSATSAANIVDSSGVAYSGSNPIPVTLLTEQISLSDTSDTIGVQQVSGAIDSTNVAQIGGNPVVVGAGYQDNALRVVHATDSVVSVNVVSDAVNLDQTTDSIATRQVSGATDSVFVVGPIAQGDAATAMRVVIAGNSDASVAVLSMPAVVVTSITNTTATNVVDSSGVAYSGSNPIPITVISGALTSTISVGDSAARAADNGGNPVKMGGIARQTNPTAFADGDRSNISTDDVGRQLTRPIQVRDLLATAYTTISTGTETTILTAGAATYLDCIWMAFANSSNASQQIDIRAVSGGNIIHTAVIPANGTIGWAPPVPWPQDATGNAWTADGADVTNSSVFITSLFSKEV